MILVRLDRNPAAKAQSSARMAPRLNARPLCACSRPCKLCNLCQQHGGGEDRQWQTLGAVCAHLMTLQKLRRAGMRKIQLPTGSCISANSISDANMCWGMRGGCYLSSLKLSGVRVSALGVSPPPPLRKYNYLTEVVVFCNRNKGLRVGMGGIWFGGHT